MHHTLTAGTCFASLDDSNRNMLRLLVNDGRAETEKYANFCVSHKPVTASTDSGCTAELSMTDYLVYFNVSKGRNSMETYKNLDQVCPKK